MTALTVTFSSSTLYMFAADSADIILKLSPYMQAVAEPWWSPQTATSGVSPDENRMHVHRCRILARGIRSHPIYYFSSYCLPEFNVSLSL